MDGNTGTTDASTLMERPKYPLRKGTNKGKRGQLRKKKTANRKSLPKGFFLVKQIINKAIIASRVYYCVIWDLSKGTKRNWIDYSEMRTCLPLMKFFDYEFRNNAAQYAHFAMKYVIRKISSVEVSSQRKALEDTEKVMRIVAYEPSTNTVVIFWENGCISPVNLKEVTDVGLKMAIGSSLFRENHWVVDYHVSMLTKVTGYSLWDESEEPEGEQSVSANSEDSQEEPFNWDEFYKKMFDNFPNEVNKYWSIVKERSPVLIFNPSFPAEDSNEDRPENLTIVSHCICTNCGRLFDQPKETLVEHILITGHIGWYAVCLVEKQELASLVARKKRKKGVATNKGRPVAPVTVHASSSVVR